MRDSTKRALEAAKTKIDAAAIKLTEDGLKYHSPGRWLGFTQDGEAIVCVDVSGEQGVVTVWQKTHTWTPAEKAAEPAAEPIAKKKTKGKTSNAT